EGRRRDAEGERERRSEHPSDEEARGEDAARPSGRDREGERDDLREDERDEEAEAELASHGELEPPVAAAEDLGREERERADAQPSERRLERGGERQSDERAAERVEDHDEERRDGAARDAEDREGEVVRRSRRPVARDREEGLEAHERPVDAVGDDAGEEREDERPGLELHLAVEHLDGEDRGAD